MEDFLTLNTLAWVVVAFFAVGWTLGVVTQKQYATKNNIMIVTWWWISIGAIIFLKLSPFFFLWTDACCNAVKSNGSWIDWYNNFRGINFF